jgi:hypothetical protein
MADSSQPGALRSCRPREMIDVPLVMADSRNKETDLLHRRVILRHPKRP